MGIEHPEKPLAIVVTGGAGFIGSHLCGRLLDHGHRVACIDNFSTGSLGKIAHLTGRPGFSLIEHDTCLPFDLACDRIYNLACPASPAKYQNDPIQTTRTAVLGSLNVLDLATRRGARVLQASTSEVYGDPTVHPQPEGYWGNVNPIGPRACYDEGKRCAESLFCDYRRQHRTDIRIARIFNTYGPRLDPGDGRVISNFIIQALSGDNLTVYGDGTQTRSFCYIDDLVLGLIRLMEHPAAPSGPVNLGNPQDISMLALAERTIALAGSDSRISFLPLPEGDPSRRKPDIGLASGTLGWRPHIPLDAGLDRTIGYFRSLTACGQ